MEVGKMVDSINMNKRQKSSKEAWTVEVMLKTQGK
jgi:hypothetical protein